MMPAAHSAEQQPAARVQEAYWCCEKEFDMADRYDREYDRDRSLWRDREDEERRDWEDEGAQDRNQENWGEFGGSTRRGWGQNRGEFRPEGYAGRGGPTGQRGGRWYGGEQDEYGQGRGYRGGRMGSQGHGYYQGRQQWGRGSQMGQAGQGRDYESGFGRGGQNWQGRGTGQGSYGQDRQSQRYGQQWGQGSQQPGWQGSRYGQAGYGQDWMEDDAEMQYYDTPVTYTYTEFWLVPGPYSGIGPDNYTRSSERLREDIIQRLTQHGEINAANINVEVNDNCEVTLTGEVDNRQAKRMAEDVAESVWGVNDIHNQIRVRGKDKQSRGSQQGGQGDGQQGQTQSATATRGQTGTRTKS
jgi:hypothetical protein